MSHMLPLDPTLPQLAKALDAKSMCDFFNENLRTESNSNIAIKECTLLRFRYRRAARANMLYELLLIDETTGHAKKQWVSGSIFKGGKAKKLSEKFLSDEAANGGNNADIQLPGFSYIQDLQMFVQCFPMDRHLPEIAKVMEHGDPAVNALLMQQFGQGDWRVEQREIVPVRYRPGMGATVRATVRARNEANDTQATQSTYLKVYRTNDPAAAFNSLTLLSDAAERSNAAFAVAAPIGYSEETGALAIVPAAGKSLEDLLLLDGDLRQIARRSAEALFAFHMSDAPMIRRRSKEVSLARAKKAADFLKWACPDLSQRIDRIYSELDKRLSDDICHPAHLDLKADHIFLNDDIVTFIDMDSAAGGDPVLDPAMLLARLRAMPDLLPISQDRVQRFGDLLTEHYFSLAPSGWRRRLGPAYACASLKVALYYLQHLEQNWREKIAQTLSSAEEHL